MEFLDYPGSSIVTFGMGFIAFLLICYGLAGETRIFMYPGLAFLHNGLGFVVAVFGFIGMLYARYRYRHTTSKLR